MRPMRPMPEPDPLLDRPAELWTGHRLAWVCVAVAVAWVSFVCFLLGGLF
jgi:hypothetical protein